MTLQLDDRQHDILEEMGISLFVSKARPSRPTSAPLAPSVSPRGPALKEETPHIPPGTSRQDLGVNPLGARVVQAPKEAQDGKQDQPGRSNPASLDALGALSWGELEGQCQSCQACSLGAQAKARVFSHPPSSFSPSSPSTPSCRVLIVADSPQLDLQGNPLAFSAVSTPLFEQLLRAASWGGVAPSAQASKHSPRASSAPRSEGSAASQEVVLTHMVKCANPTVSVELSQSLTCLHYLKAQIQLLKPQVLLVMGRMAAQALVHQTEQQGLPHGKLCGRVLSFEGTPMVITQAPEYLWRMGQDKAKTWHDLCLVLSLLEQAPGSVGPSARGI
jgi:uracil-DNA glycosylase